MNQFLLLAQSDDEVAAGVMMVMMAFAIIIGLAVFLAIQGFICWITAKTIEAIPTQHREIEPGSAWLLMIPCFNIIWNFFVFPKISASYQRYFASVGNYSNGDCAAQLATWYCLCIVFQLIPLVNYIAGPASLILLVIMLVKFWDYKSQVERGAVGAPAYNPAQVTPARKIDPSNPYA